MPEQRKQYRKALLVAATLSTIGSIPLFIYRPVPPVGLFAAFDLLLMAGFFFWQAFRPQGGQSMIQKLEKWNKATDDPNEPARWVP